MNKPTTTTHPALTALATAKKTMLRLNSHHGLGPGPVGSGDPMTDAQYDKASMLVASIATLALDYLSDAGVGDEITANAVEAIEQFAASYPTA